MSAGLAVTAKTGNLGEIEAELVLEPVDSVSGTTGEDTDQVVTSKLASLG